MNLINIHDFGKGCFNTAKGWEIDLLQPAEESIDIEDIAHALSNICRFGGHCYPFYSVAQHSLIVAALAPQPLKLAALLHDAPEAYLGDVIKPLKNLLAHHYTQFEELFEVVIGNKFGIDYLDLMAIKEYDRLALEIEHEALQKGNFARLLSVMFHNNLLQNDWAYTPAVAETEFMDAFVELIEARDRSNEEACTKMHNSAG